jgi:hypothetical protein
MSHDDRKFRPWYTPDTARWLRLSLAARGLIAELLRKWDDRGEIRAESAEDIAILLRLSLAEVEPALDECIRAGRLQWDGTGGVLRDPDFAARMRRSSAERMRDKRRRDAERAAAVVTDVTPCDARDVTSVTHKTVTGSDVTSPLLSSDLISSSREGEREREAPPDKAPDWFVAVCDGIAMDTGEQFAVPEAWLRYSNHRATKGIAVSERDARYWLGTVMVPEARKDRRAESDRRLNQQRRDGPPEKPKPSREEARREAQAFAAAMAARNKGAA